MFLRNPERGLAHRALSIAELIFHGAARSVRTTNRSALWAILLSILQSLLMGATFYLLYLMIPGFRSAAIRGDYLLYIMSGIFVYMTHIKAVSAVAGADGPSSQMMQHMPMNTIIAIGSVALGALYTQFMTIAVILGAYHVGWGPVQIEDPFGAACMFLMAWASGVSVGMVLRPLRPFLPDVIAMTKQVYIRLNMIASGKMFVANQMPSHIIALFAWNPLFHIIDQGRGYLFVNYTPLKSGLAYPIFVSLALLMIGLMGEFMIRNRVSASMSAGR